MNTKARDQFLQLVESYIKEDPEAAAYIHLSVQHGLREFAQECQEKSTDMEAIAVACTAKRFKNLDEFIRQKLERWKDKTAFNWDSFINKK